MAEASDSLRFISSGSTVVRVTLTILFSSTFLLSLSYFPYNLRPFSPSFFQFLLLYENVKQVEAGFVIIGQGKAQWGM
jgi:hypothetical protein